MAGEFSFAKPDKRGGRCVLISTIPSKPSNRLICIKADPSPVRDSNACFLEWWLVSADLFEPVRMGRYLLTNRVVMAPLTRSRAHADGRPRAFLMATYYGQRASAGLIISEGTNISPQAKGYAFTPGIHNREQVEGWQVVTEEVHAKGGRIFCQLWHVGRISHPSLQPNGGLPVAPSAIAPAVQAFTEKGFLPCVTPRPLLTDEMPDIVEQYRHAARLALAAGFDGVEIHAANGYLLEQFLRDRTNQRTDVYGGLLPNRARLLLEVTEAVAGICGGLRLASALNSAV